MKITKNKAFYFTITALILILALMFVLAAIYRNEHSAQYKALNSEEKGIITRVGKLLNLPNETPIISTIYNEKDFKDNQTFKDIKTGDKLIIYLNANQSILYRPSTNTVVDIAPVRAELKTR